MAIGRPRTNKYRRQEYFRKRYQEKKEARAEDQVEESTEEIERQLRKPMVRSHITWLELSSGRSNT